MQLLKANNLFPSHPTAHCGNTVNITSQLLGHFLSCVHLIGGSMSQGWDAQPSSLANDAILTQTNVLEDFQHINL